VVSIVDPYSSKNFANAESSDWNLYGVEVWAYKFRDHRASRNRIDLFNLCVKKGPHLT